MFLTIVGIIVILFLFFKFGIGVITQISGVSNMFNQNEPTPTPQQENRLRAPILDPVTEATNSAQIEITGKSSEKDLSIQLFVNDKLGDETKSDLDGKFRFENVVLDEGQNVIKARIKQDSETSNFSKEYTIFYQKSEPKLDVTSPVEDAKFIKENNEAPVQGKTDPENKITVNGFWAIVDNQGNFSYNLTLSPGENAIEVEVTDRAGNKVKKAFKVSYQP